MNIFFRRSINEYQRQIGLKESFAIQTGRLQSTLESVNWAKFEQLPTNRRHLRRRLGLLLLSPLVEIAWADGCVTRRESDVILQVAESYGLVKNDADYRELLEKLTSRPMPQAVGRMWGDFYYFFENLPEFERQTIAYCLTVQAQFVAEQSSNNLLAFLRGERVCESEREALRIVVGQLKNAQETAKSLEEKRNAVLSSEKEANEMREQTAQAAAADDYFGEYKPDATLDDYSKLIPLVPLVKTAWAECRITKRERWLIFEAAARMGIEPDTANHKRLSEWLELPPTEDYYVKSLERLNADWENLPEEEKVLRRLELLSDCVNIAEASGGTSRYPSGGVRVCDEEIAVVNSIAQKLNVVAVAA